jgi:hypothetical protein
MPPGSPPQCCSACVQVGRGNLVGAPLGAETQTVGVGGGGVADELSQVVAELMVQGPPPPPPPFGWTTRTGASLMVARMGGLLS